MIFPTERNKKKKKNRDSQMLLNEHKEQKHPSTRMRATRSCSNTHYMEQGSGCNGVKETAILNKVRFRPLTIITDNTPSSTVI